ncbi:hypothetical protein ZIOFF_021949 [Zingiber officinale]|uniref:Deoxyuridine 5'-triphosphate nucleotidohydrolase n=1 Tax=Zingiber officinale TaxID=94328 RepID=A0A8J5H7Q7_ZINOF|nr:hypothetical protein ZIOFF_021949 [Zingiber officinale]
MKIPWGTYSGIATRSSAAFKLGLDIGASVIDCDYRGEIKILAFNHSDQFIHIYRGDCVAQLILEYIAIPEVYEVKNLTPTKHGTEGFGSTTPIPQNKSHKKKEARWDTLGEPSGKYDYYVNYAIPDPLPDLELPTPSWDDEPQIPQQITPLVMDILLSKERHTILTFTHKGEHFQRSPEEDHAGATSSGATVLRSMDTIQDDSDYDFLHQI